jgi:phosphoribosylformylglycinamidine synthase
MILFFQAPNQVIFVVHSLEQPDNNSIEKLCWLFGGATAIDEPSIVGWFKGPRKEMLTPWSTNAVEITQNMGIDSILRIEQFFPVNEDSEYDPMLEIKYQGLDQEVYKIERLPEPVIEINDISTYNDREGLALSKEEVDYLEDISKRIGRKLTDSEVFGFSQVNSEHCRHKIFNGTFIIDGQEKEESLFRMIKNTSSEHPNRLISAYKDNVAFMEGPEIEQFAPGRQDVAEYFMTTMF